MKANAKARSAPAVLVVDDDKAIRAFLSEVLADEGFRVKTAVNGRTALDLLATGFRPCVILLDLMMPVMDGWQFRQAQAGNAALADIPVIVVSAAGKDLLRRIEANAYLSKPVDLDELLGCVTQFCRP